MKSDKHRRSKQRFQDLWSIVLRSAYTMHELRNQNDSTGCYPILKMCKVAVLLLEFGTQFYNRQVRAFSEN